MIYETKAGGESLPLPSHDMLARVRNPDASMDLIIPIVMACNTPDAELLANIATNAASVADWVAAIPAHGRAVAICGSGPSLSDDLDEVRRLAREGAIVLALNGAARFLATHAIIPDYQFIADARPENINLIGPAAMHIFASQVHPSLFETVDAMLVHVGDDSLQMPEYGADYTIVASHSSVGNVALCLAYVLGFRDIHCFGFDSSHRDGGSHAFDQPMNAGEPTIYVERNGKRYLASFTMRQQAEVFPGVARDLQALGCAITVHGEGLLPDAWNGPPMSEREKYQRLWEMPQYRAVAPGEDCVATFLRRARPWGGASILDFGCGTGRASVRLRQAGLRPILIDFAANCRDREALTLPFVEHDLIEPLPLRAEYGFCTDVMEHIPPEHTETVLANIFDAITGSVFFQIDTQPDRCGALIGEKLHINLRDHDGWRALVSRHGVIVHEECNPGSSIFYVVAVKEKHV